MRKKYLGDDRFRSRDISMSLYKEVEIEVVVQPIGKSEIA